MLQAAPVVFDIFLPNESIQAFDLNFIVVVVGMYSISRIGALNPKLNDVKSVITISIIEMVGQTNRITISRAVIAGMSIRQ